MFNLGPWEVGLILVVALIVIGPGKLPEVARSVGKAMSEFKKVTNSYKKEFQDAMNSIEEPDKQVTKAKPTAQQAQSGSDTEAGESNPDSDKDN